MPPIAGNGAEVGPGTVREWFAESNTFVFAARHRCRARMGAENRAENRVSATQTIVPP